MPNHIQNELSLTGDAAEVAAVMQAIRGNEGGRITFRAIIPMPPSLDTGSESLHIVGCAKAVVEQGLTIDQALQKQVAFFRSKGWTENIPGARPGDAEAVELYASNLRTYGHCSWYGWCMDNWGTKWDAYETPDHRDSAERIYFQTAWTAPSPILKALGIKYPTVQFRLRYADEDYGENLGDVTCHRGTILLNSSPERDTPEARRFARLLHDDAGAE